MPALPVEAVPGLIAGGASCRSSENVAARLKPGDKVLVRNINPVHHTRLPRYVRGKRGTVELDHGVFHFPDTNAHGLGHNPQHVYNVRFTARELWGPEAPGKDSLSIDLFEDYVDKA